MHYRMQLTRFPVATGGLPVISIWWKTEVPLIRNRFAQIMSHHTRRLVRNRQTLFVRIVFFYWKTTWDCLARGVFSIGYRGFRYLDTLLDGSNDFDETLIEYGPGLHLPGGMGNYPRKIQLEKAQRKNVLSMLKPIGFLGRSFNWTFLKIRSNDLLHFSL